ncbi:MAG: hypothetical protein GX575_03395 [Candidatus Anammoximicrobium sp.]|nr:hypothetical protein [Candidatus Anammoximicrobium sp.]
MKSPRWLYHPREPLSEARDPVTALGGKGAALRMLCAAGLPTPPCFTIGTEACRQYLAGGRCWPDGLWEQVVEAVGELERKVGRPFCSAPQPLLLAVRSGGPESMPGMLLTLLNCGLTQGLAESLADAGLWSAYVRFVSDFAAATGFELHAGSDELRPHDARRGCLALLEQYACVCGRPFPQDPWDLLQQCISAVFDSWSSERAATFRRLRQLDDASGTAVTVQAMLAVEAAGVLFSHDPRQPGGEAFVIEAVRGLGDQLVSGHAQPQRYEVDRAGTVLPGRRAGPARLAFANRLSVQATTEPGEPILDASQLTELCALAVRVESLLGGPADVEWGWAAGQFWLFQARRMDQPDSGQRLAEVRAEELERLERSAREYGTRLWVRHNLDETLPAPTPLTWDLVRRWMSGRGGYGRLYRGLGYAPSRRVCEHGFLELVAGRIYADPDRLAEIFGAGWPVGYDVNALQRSPQLIERGPTSLAPERADPWLLFRLPVLLWTVWRGSRRVKRESVRVAERFEQRALPTYLTYVRQQRQADLTPLSDAELAALLEERCARVLDEFAAEWLRPAFFAALAMRALESRLVRLMGAEEGGRGARDLVRGLAEPPTAACQAALYRLAQGQLSVAQFLQEFGHRGPGEMELAAPRWREIPNQLQRLAAWLRDTKAADPETLRQRAAEERERAWRSLAERLADHGASSFIPVVEREARQAQQLLPYRESARHTFLLGYELIRQAVREIGRRRKLGEDVFFLRYDELSALQFSREGIRQRRQRWQLVQRLAVPETVDPGHLEALDAAPPQPATAGVRMEATVISAGTARGPVRIWTAARSAYDMPAGSVLVCPSLDTGLTPLLLRAVAVVVERGGLLSHGAIVARQLGIPAVVLAGAGQLLRDGQVVVVDGDRGCLVCEGESAP